MRDDRDAPRSPATGSVPEDRLDSWKEIAAYLGRGIRTVQRWEREEGMPVHRLVHDKGGSIYAMREELAAWWESRRLTLATGRADAQHDTPVAPRLERVTRTTAMTAWPALSSDGRLIAYVSDAGQDGTAPQIWIQQIGGASLQLTRDDRAYSHLSFSPDDTRIVYVASDGAEQNVYEVPTLGGEPRLLKRAAGDARFSPDGRWFAYVPTDGTGVRISARGGAGSRTVAAELINVSCLQWLPDSQSLLVHARPDPGIEADWWQLPIGGGSPLNIGIVRRLREVGISTIPSGVAWADNSLVFVAYGAQGIRLYRQRFVPDTWQPAGAPERLTEGHESPSSPTVAGRRLAYVSSRADLNLWSVALDPANGVAHGPLRRMTRGPGIILFLTVSRDGETLAYFSPRLGEGQIFLRNVATGLETVFEGEPPGGKGYPAISPSGRQLAYATIAVEGERALRPIFIADLTSGTSRTLGEDCGGRPREWVDERILVIERFARLNSIALVDTDTGAQHTLLESGERSIKHPRLSPDRRWIAFESSLPSGASTVLLARFGSDKPIPESDWVVVDRTASHPFWSADGRLVYYTPTGANPFVRGAVRARRVAPRSGLPEGDSIPVYSSQEMSMPAYLPGTSPIATRDQIILVLGDFRGDIWITDV